MGLLDLPSPIFYWVDGLLTSLPTAVRLALWGIAAGLGTMLLYRAVSPQARIAAAKQEQLEQRKRLDAFDGELAEAWPLIARLLRLSLLQVARVTGPAVIASLPVLFVLVWISTAYGHVYPGSTAPAVKVEPAHLQARWLDARPPRIVITDPTDGWQTEVPLQAPVPVIERRHWWNALIGNPAGYLAAESPAERIEIDLPRQECLPIGPSWMRGWEFTFFAALIATSLLLKRVLRIH